MPNGAAIRLPCTSEIPAASEPFDPQLGGVEGWIDAILVALMDMSTQACAEIQAGGLSGQTRLQGGDLLGRLCVLQGNIGERDFAAAVRRTGRRPTRHGAPLSEAAIDDVIEIVSEITAAVHRMN